jgi:hypothetical protein
MPQTKGLPHHRIDFEHDFDERQHRLRQLLRKRVCRRLLPRSVQLAYGQTGCKGTRVTRIIVDAGRVTATACGDVGAL